MKYLSGGIGAALFLAATMVQVSAQTVIPINASGGIWNTGVGPTGATLPDGTVDSHWTIVSSPDGPSTETAKTSASGFPIGPWIGDDTASDWIGETAGYPSLTEGVGVYDNRLTFTSTASGTLTLVGQWATDDVGNNILIDGAASGVTAGGFGSFTTFTITEPVTVGTNTIDLLQQNNGGPGGVRAEFTSATVSAVPEPAALGPILLAAAGAAAGVRRRFRA